MAHTRSALDDINWAELEADLQVALRDNAAKSADLDPSWQGPVVTNVPKWDNNAASVIYEANFDPSGQLPEVPVAPFAPDWDNADSVPQWDNIVTFLIS
ncbi:hypothetical protein VTO42DRAFT_3061 [Malbranchea cinnamomea]